MIILGPDNNTSNDTITKFHTCSVWVADVPLLSAIPVVRKILGIVMSVVYKTVIRVQDPRQ